MASAFSVIIFSVSFVRAQSVEDCREEGPHSPKFHLEEAFDKAEQSSGIRKSEDLSSSNLEIDVDSSILMTDDGIAIEAEAISDEAHLIIEEGCTLLCTLDENGNVVPGSVELFDPKGNPLAADFDLFNSHISGPNSNPITNHYFSQKLVGAIEGLALENGELTVDSDGSSRQLAANTQVTARAHRNEDGDLVFSEVRTFAQNDDEENENLTAVAVDFKNDSLQEKETDFKADDIELGIDSDTGKTVVSIQEPLPEEDEILLAGIDALEHPVEDQSVEDQEILGLRGPSSPEITAPEFDEITIETPTRRTTSTFDFDSFFDAGFVAPPEDFEGNEPTERFRALERGPEQARDNNDLIADRLPNFRASTPPPALDLNPNAPGGFGLDIANLFGNLFDNFFSRPRQTSDDDEQNADQDTEPQTLRERLANSGQSLGSGGPRRRVGGGAGGLPTAAPRTLASVLPQAGNADASTGFVDIQEGAESLYSQNPNVDPRQIVRDLANQQAFTDQQNIPSIAELDAALPITPQSILESSVEAYEEAYDDWRVTAVHSEVPPLDPFSEEALEDDKIPDRKELLARLMKGLAKKHKFGSSQGAQFSKTINLNREPSIESPGSLPSSSAEEEPLPTDDVPWDLLAKAVEANRRPDEYLKFPSA